MYKIDIFGYIELNNVKWIYNEYETLRMSDEERDSRLISLVIPSDSEYFNNIAKLKTNILKQLN